MEKQRLPTQHQFAAIWLFGKEGPFTYIPADPNLKDNPQIYNSNPFSPAEGTTKENYIVARVIKPKNEPGKKKPKIHAEQVIREQVWHINI